MPQTNADWITTFAFLQADGTPIDLSSGDLRMELRRAPGAPDAVLSLVPGDGLNLAEAPQGRVRIEVSHAQMNPVPAGVYAFDIIRILGPVRSVLCAGSITIREGVTQ